MSIRINYERENKISKPQRDVRLNFVMVEFSAHKIITRHGCVDISAFSIAASTGRVRYLTAKKRL